MKKIGKKICCIIVIAIGIVALLIFLSTIPVLTPVIDMITNSVTYQGMGEDETLGLLKKVKESGGKNKLIIGDSVAGQLYTYRDNEEYCAMPGNMAMSPIWQYVYVRDYLEINPTATDVYLCMTADGLEYSFETKLSYSYLLIPLAESNNMNVLEEEQKELLDSMYGSAFVKPEVISFIGKSGLNTKLYLNAIDKFYEIFPDRKERVEKKNNVDCVLAETYIMKMYELCQVNNVKLHLIPNPKKDTPECREYLEQLEAKYEQSPLYQINPEYFEQIVFYPKECFKDELHFTDEFLEDGGKLEIIKEVQKSTGELQGLFQVTFSKK